MKIIVLAAVTLLLSLRLWAQTKPIITETITINGMQGSMRLEFDTISKVKHKYTLIYERNGNLSVCADSSFVPAYSAWELSQKLPRLADTMLLRLRATASPDTTPVKTDLKPVLNNMSPGLYASVQSKLSAPPAKVQANFDTFSLNDSLAGQMVGNCLLRIYYKKKDKKEIKLVFKDTVTNTDTTINALQENRDTFAGLIPIKNIKALITDGFIYSFAFEIDDTKLPEALRGVFNPNQAFSIRINLRHNILAEMQLSNRKEIPLRKIHSRIVDDPHPNTEFVFYAAELLQYMSPRGASNPIFTAKDTIVYFNCDGVTKIKDTARIREKSFYSIVNLDVFGDMVGFFDDKNPNGLIQTELKVNFYGFRRPWREKAPTTARVTALNKAEIFFRISKLDNKSRFLPVLRADSASTGGQRKDTVRYIHGYRILEFQNIYAGLRINLLDIEYRGGGLAFTTELSFVRTPLRDTIFRIEQKNNRIDTIPSPTTFGLNSMIIVPGINLGFFRSSYMDIDLHGRVFFIHPLNNRIKASRSAFDDFYGSNSYNDIVTPKLYNIGAVINVYLNNDRTRRLIIRGENYIDQYRRGNNFWQAQIGYSADLNRFINLNNPNRR
jgi:hypothetical protein